MTRLLHRPRFWNISFVNITHCAMYWPICGNSHQCKDGSTYWDDGDETAYFAIDISKGPVSIQHVDVIKGHIQRRHHGISNAQVHWKGSNLESVAFQMSLSYYHRSSCYCTCENIISLDFRAKYLCQNKELRKKRYLCYLLIRGEHFDKMWH